jgi:hypothetical protein
MGQVIWSPSALEDIEQIAQFISKDSSDQAAIFVGRLIVAAIDWHPHPSQVESSPKSDTAPAGRSSTAPIASCTDAWARMSGLPGSFTAPAIGSLPSGTYPLNDNITRISPHKLTRRHPPLCVCAEGCPWTGGFRDRVSVVVPKGPASSLRIKDLRDNSSHVVHPLWLSVDPGVRSKDETDRLCAVHPVGGRKEFGSDADGASRGFVPGLRRT